MTTEINPVSAPVPTIAPVPTASMPAAPELLASAPGSIPVSRTTSGKLVYWIAAGVGLIALIYYFKNKKRAEPVKTPETTGAAFQWKENA
jgi:hypothetical protein